MTTAMLRPSSGGNRGNSGPADPAGTSAQLVPFVVGATEGASTGLAGLSGTIGAAPISFPNLELPPTGWLRGMWVVVTGTTAGNAANVAFKSDGPWSALASLRFNDISGNALYGELSGYEVYLSNLLGGYWPVQDPALNRLYYAVTGAGATGGSFRCAYWIPAEIIGREGFGALENMAANSTFRFALSLGTLSDIYATAPTAAPTFSVSFHPESWNKPSLSYMGQPVSQTPPRPDSTQYWSRQTTTWTGTAPQQIKLLRTGFTIRNLVVVFRDGAGARLADSAMPPQIEWVVDNKSVRNALTEWWLMVTAQRAGLTGPTGLPSGVIGVSMCHDENMRQGNELRSLYFPTAEATSMSLRFTPSAAGSVTILTNDLAITAG